MKSPTNRSPLGQGVRAVALAGAGVAAFAIGMRLSAPSGAQASEGDVVAPVTRAGAAARTDIPAAPGPASAVIASPVAPTSERLSDSVTHNPFGALNLNAGAVPSAIDEARARMVLNKPKAPLKPPPPPPPPPVPAPVAPPLPFTAVGSIAGAEVTDGQPVAFIRQQDRLLLVRAGDAIGQQYRVESVNAQKVEFIYLPLMQRQALVLAP